MNNYLDILKPNKITSDSLVRKIYLKLVKENHPDLFPEEHRAKQNLILMEINEAYMMLATQTNSVGTESPVKARGFAGENNSIIIHKNPDYVYYKSGLKYYQEGLYSFNDSRFSIKGDNASFETDDESVLKSALYSLELFILSYKYFKRLIMEFPDSMWTHDSLEKMSKIEELNLRYCEIIDVIIRKQVVLQDGGKTSNNSG